MGSPLGVVGPKGKWLWLRIAPSSLRLPWGGWKGEDEATEVLSSITLRLGLEPAWARGAGKNWLERDSQLVLDAQEAGQAWCLGTSGNLLHRCLDD